MSDFPNREHANEDRTARQQAIEALDAIARDAEVLKRRLSNGSYADVTDAESLVAKAGQVARRLAVLDTLRHVREWHAADVAAPKGQ
jgi:hypothetical protein